jgi:hypothetical protein
VLAERHGRPDAEGDIEQDVSGRGEPAAPARVVDEPPHLLVARPDEREPARHGGDAAVGLGDRNGAVVEHLERGHEPEVDPGAGRRGEDGGRHRTSIAKNSPRLRADFAPKRSK